MGTPQAAVKPPSDVNIPAIRNEGGKGGRDGALSPSPGRGERADGSGSNTPKSR
jgi:hypothetical protein